MQDSKGKTICWVWLVGSEPEEGPETDFHALSQGRVSVTPLQFNLTRHATIASLSGWHRRSRYAWMLSFEVLE